MELLGLSIQKINYSTKGQGQKKTESTRSIAQGLVPEALLADNNQTIYQPGAVKFTLSNQHQQNVVRRRPQTVRRRSRSSLN